MQTSLTHGDARCCPGLGILRDCCSPAVCAHQHVDVTCRAEVGSARVTSDHTLLDTARLSPQSQSQSQSQSKSDRPFFRRSQCISMTAARPSHHPTHFQLPTFSPSTLLLALWLRGGTTLHRDLPQVAQP